MVLLKLAVAAVILVHSWYPKECCNGDEHSGDCHPIPCEEIIKVDSYGRMFAYTNGGGGTLAASMIRRSLDDQRHVCIHYFPAAGRGVPQCIFLKRGPIS